MAEGSSAASRSSAAREKIAKLARHRTDLDTAIAELSGFVMHLESLDLPPGAAAEPTGD
jgi:hypothetical protein